MDLSTEAARVAVFSTVGCRFCKQAKELLRTEKIVYVDVDLSRDQHLRSKVTAVSGSQTVPQVRDPSPPPPPPPPPAGALLVLAHGTVVDMHVGSRNTGSGWHISCPFTMNIQMQLFVSYVSLRQCSALHALLMPV